MILAGDDYTRILRQLKAEKEKVLYYLSKNECKLERKFREQRTLPVCHCENITLPKTNNTYLLGYYAMTLSEVVERLSFTCAPLILNDDSGRLMAITYRKMDIQDGVRFERTIDTLHIYTGHFFSRYRERTKLPKDLSSNEVITTFFGRNSAYFAMLEYEDFVLEKNRHKGNRAFGVDDGVILSHAIDMEGFLVLRHNTFLSRSELKPSQEIVTPSQDFMRSLVLNRLK